MLSFPAPRWRTALLATTVSSQSYRGLKLGCASLITPRVYLSDYYTARDTKELSRLGITHVISVIELDPEIPQSIPEKNRLHVPIADRPDVDILGYLGDTTEFIRMALEESEENVVLVCSIVFVFVGIMRTHSCLETTCNYIRSTAFKGSAAAPPSSAPISLPHRECWQLTR